MATTNRAALLTKVHKVLKKHFTAPADDPRPLMEELIFACCLENAPHAAASSAFEVLKKQFFDWNEVRVSSIRELSEVMTKLPHPETSAAAVRKLLQTVFDKCYTYDLDHLQKLALGKALTELETLSGASLFGMARVTQSNLGGHAIPLSKGALEVLKVVGALTEAEIAKGSFGAVDRAIPKTKGAEFAGLLHECGAMFQSDPYAPALHKILLEMSPDAKSRLPKRPEPQAPKAAAKSSSKPAAGKPEPAKATGGKSSDGKSSDGKAPRGKSAPVEAAPPPPPAKKSSKGGKKAPEPVVEEAPPAPKKKTSKPAAKAPEKPAKAAAKKGSTRSKPR